MGQPSKSKPATKAEQLTKVNDNLQIIYADRVINAGFGPVVCKLTLAMETGSGTYNPTATLILPTSSLLDAMNAVLNGIQGNPAVKEGMLKGLDTLKEQLNNL